MNVQEPTKSICVAALLAGCLLVSANSLADGSNPDSGTAAPTPRPINFQILSQTKVDFNGSSTTFNFVAPPVIPAATPVATPPPTVAYLQWLQAREKKAYKFIFLCATVYDRQITEIHCSCNGLGWWHVFSDINFDYFTGAGEFETADTIYEYILMAGDDTTQALIKAMPAPPAFVQARQTTLTWLKQARLQLPDLSIQPSSKSAYLIADGSTSDNSGMLDALNAVHAYYDANHVQLIAAYQQRVAAQASAEAYAKAHPPGPPPPVVINFWPVKNSRYLKAATGGSQ